MEPESVVVIAPTNRESKGKRLGTGQEGTKGRLTPALFPDTGEVDVLNCALRKVFNPSLADVPDAELERDYLESAAPAATCWRFRKHDRVHQLKNNPPKHVANGELGRVEQAEHGGGLVVNFGPAGLAPKLVSYAPDEVHELAPGYALTVHKAQGDQYPAVVFAVIANNPHFSSLTRDLIYTAVSRAERVLVVVETRNAVQMGASCTRLSNHGLAARINLEVQRRRRQHWRTSEAMQGKRQNLQGPELTMRLMHELCIDKACRAALGKG